MSAEENAITRWFESLKNGDRQAAERLWAQYFDRMTRLARATLRARAPGLAVVDEEDAALSAFESFCLRAERGVLPDLAGRDDLWRLLAIITVRKARAQLRRQRRLKRGGGKVLRESELVHVANGDPRPMDAVPSDRPDPELAVAAAEELEHLLGLLGDDTLRSVALRRLEGWTCDDIAAEHGCARRTVARQLRLIRTIWTARASEER